MSARDEFLDTYSPRGAERLQNPTPAHFAAPSNFPELLDGKPTETQEWIAP